MPLFVHSQEYSACMQTFTGIEIYILLNNIYLCTGWIRINSLFNFIFNFYNFFFFFMKTLILALTVVEFNFGLFWGCYQWRKWSKMPHCLMQHESAKLASVSQCGRQSVVQVQRWTLMSREAAVTNGLAYDSSGFFLKDISCTILSFLFDVDINV